MAGHSKCFQILLYCKCYNKYFREKVFSLHHMKNITKHKNKSNGKWFLYSLANSVEQIRQWCYLSLILFHTTRFLILLLMMFSIQSIWKYSVLYSCFSLTIITTEIIIALVYSISFLSPVLIILLFLRTWNK